MPRDLTPDPVRFRPVLLLAAALASGCGSSGDEGVSPRTAALAPAPTRGRYVAVTTGTAEQRLAALDAMVRQYATTEEPDPRAARAARDAYVAAATATAKGILALPNLQPNHLRRASDTVLTIRFRFLDSNPDSLKQLEADAREILDRYPKTDAATLAAFSITNAIATAPVELFSGPDERFDRLSAAALVLAEQTPTHPDTVKILSETLPAAEKLGRVERAVAMIRRLAELAPDGPGAAFREGQIRRLQAIGKPLGPFGGVGIDGKPISVQDFRGKVVLIDFWATWCEPCTRELPALRALNAELVPRGFQVVGVDIDETSAPLELFLRKNDVPWPQIFDQPEQTATGAVRPPSGAVGASDPGDAPTADAPPTAPASPEDTLQFRWGVAAIPLKMVVDREGNLVATGFSLEDVRAKLLELLDRPAPTAPDAPPARPPA